MLGYTIGYITGLIIAVLLFVIEIYLSKRGKSAIQSIEKAVEKRTAQKGAIIMPIPDAVRSMERKIEENEKRGLDTKMDDILKN